MKWVFFNATFVVLAIISTTCVSKKKDAADLIVINAHIWTGDGNVATALAIRDTKIVAVGNDSLLQQWQDKQTTVLDAKGKFITPGFIDAHVHFIAGGTHLLSIDLRNTTTRKAFIQAIADFVKTKKRGEWIIGGAWNHTHWGGELPNKNWIDSITKEHPVFVASLDGHMGLANSATLKMAGIDAHTPEINGGRIVRNAQGEPTGILQDNAMKLIFKIIPPPSKEAFQKIIQASTNYMAANGVSSAHVMLNDEPNGSAEALEQAHKNNQLSTRIYMMMPIQQWASLKDKLAQQGNGDEWLKIGCLKGFVDGSLGSHTAAFKKPYADMPADKGLLLYSKDSLKQWIHDADKAGLQLAVHAIGDEAIHFLLHTVEEVEKQNGKRDRRFRIEHAQHIAPEDIKRFATLNIIASMQPYHAIDDGQWAEKLIGKERIQTTYAFKSLLHEGARLVFGSDWFVAPANVMEGIYAAVTRRTLDHKNPNGWIPAQKISVEQALQAYTIHAAYASFEEHIKGSLSVGKLADFIVLDKNLFAIPAEQIREVKVLQTFVGGKKVFDRVSVE